jgi:stearoyl-CoA desaturase (delta-9 desaturase)
MKTFAELSRSYYLYFNLPLHFLLIASVFFIEISIPLVVLFYAIVYWVGVQAGSHKLFSHNTWVPKFNFLKYIVALISCFGLMGGPVSWARMHRYHHANSDTDHDPHTPKKGFYVSYIGWLLNPPNAPFFIIKDLLKDKLLCNIEKYCRQIVMAVLTIIFLFDPTVFASLLLAMVLTFHSEMLVNSFLHKKVGNKYTSVNNAWLSLISGGSTLHKNHHDNPGKDNFGTTWYEIDLSYFIIKLLKK